MRLKNIPHIHERSKSLSGFKSWRDNFFDQEKLLTSYVVWKEDESRAFYVFFLKSQ